ncbi:hypothetical protein M1843_09315 [Isoptericola sp. 4D.3]|jgi:hypothetical protein|uniref:Uncharacterized protein n=1 Tax=Isoptericola peretonis TaxID=2918523 RepID=A0ABT0J367_9MICO|nr:hypothetical protein [Isoptericola sp. 4D.3]
MPVPTPVPSSVPTPTRVPARPILPSPHTGTPARRATAGDRLTVDPDDRRRRARTALLELAVARSAERRRAF